MTSNCTRTVGEQYSIPPAFICTSSKKIMEEPLLALCGHLFDKKVLKKKFHCPIDQMLLDPSNCIPCNELKDRITTWISSNAESSHCNSDIKLLQQEIAKIEIETKKISPTKVIKNAHRDDIHGFIFLPNGYFVSGSKDTTLNIWNIEGKLQQNLKPSCKQGYRYWITALSSFRNGLWASATRDGFITIWNQNAKEISHIEYHPSEHSRNQYVCKDRNKKRINCITELSSEENHLTFYTGTPRFIQLWNGATNRLMKYYKANDNDWIYCIEVLENKDLIVVIGSDLEVWNMQRGDPPLKTHLIQEERKMLQRPHISSIVRLEPNKNHLAAALFDGTVRIVDITARTNLRNYSEHRGRVWSVINLTPSVFASSADDRTIKIWDSRQEHSVFTLDKNPGRVSSLLRINETTFISGSCPDKVFISSEKASISFWDIRQITYKHKFQEGDV